MLPNNDGADVAAEFAAAGVGARDDVALLPCCAAAAEANRPPPEDVCVEGAPDIWFIPPKRLGGCVLDAPGSLGPLAAPNGFEGAGAELVAVALDKVCCGVEFGGNRLKDGFAVEVVSAVDDMSPTFGASPVEAPRFEEDGFAVSFF